MATEEWLTPFRKANIAVRPYFKEVEFVWENAVLTAEGFLLEYYASAKRRISGEHFYIAGFGKVGKMTAAVLASLRSCCNDFGAFLGSAWGSWVGRI